MKYLKLFGKIVKNKKGLDEDFTDTLVATIFIVLIFIFVFVYIYSNTTSIEKVLAEKISNLEKDCILLNYLRTPMEGKDITIVEYLGSLSKKELEESMNYNGLCYEGKVRGTLKEGLLTKETKEILKDIANWRVGMLIPGEEEFCYITKGVQQQRRAPILGEPIKAVILSNDPNFNIEIYFKFKS